MLQRLPIASAQIKAGNTSTKLVTEIRQIIYSLHREKEITKKVYNDRMNSIKLQDRMDTIFMNFENPIRCGLLEGIKSRGGRCGTKNHTFENPLLIVKIL